MVKTFPIPNPKRTSSDNSRTNWFSYYAGYSPDFVRGIIESTGLKPEACVADPWNGGGTTTTIANALGYTSKGVDLNPVMVVASKACLLSPLEIPSINPLTNDIIKKTISARYKPVYVDPLVNWLSIEGAQQFRILEKSVKKLLVEQDNHDIVKSLKNGENNLSCIACFFYVALFRVLRNIIQSFYSSNPTWVKVAKNDSERIDISKSIIIEKFRDEIERMILEMSYDTLSNKITNSRTEFAVASSESLPWQPASIDLIVTSPPYCTRIDYAVATMPELAILDSNFESEFDILRRNLIGTTTVPKEHIEVHKAWGNSCLNFLDKLYHHESKASKSYYFKSHTQYFSSLFNSISEIKRVLVTEGNCIAVLQDSFYKDIHNNLPKIFSEMVVNNNLKITKQIDFQSFKSMSGINRKSKIYRKKVVPIESVIFIQKT